jgi:hypothetical protein
MAALARTFAISQDPSMLVHNTGQYSFPQVLKKSKKFQVNKDIYLE